MELKGKIAAVIGGTSGIGQAIARGFLKDGAKVVASSTNPEKVDAMSKEISEYHEPLAVPVNVCNSSSLTELYRQIVEKFGSLDIVVNCAGTHLKKKSEDVTDEEWERVIDINLNGLFYSCREAGKVMLEQKSGSIINIASLGSVAALSDAAAYCASKAGVHLLTKNLAVEWADRGVRVNALVPGVFRTELNAKALSDPERQRIILGRTPMGRFGKVEELVGAAVYLASDKASFTTGASIEIDGGYLAKGI